MVGERIVERKKVQKLGDIIAWQKAREVVDQIYKLTSTDKFRRDSSLKDQIRRASIEVLRDFI
jgi:hypothetical protein